MCVCVCMFGGFYICGGLVWGVALGSFSSAIHTFKSGSFLIKNQAVFNTYDQYAWHTHVSYHKHR